MDGQVVMEPVGIIHGSGARQKVSKNLSIPPYVLERTDVWCTQSELNLVARILVCKHVSKQGATDFEAMDDEKKTDARGSDPVGDGDWINGVVRMMLAQMFDDRDGDLSRRALTQIACVTVQQRLRRKLSSLEAVAFISDGAILPRKSGASEQPMTVPNAVPCKAPTGSPMSKDIQVDVGVLLDYLPQEMTAYATTATMITIPGLIVPNGITLICGGGYHGKSTLLRAIAAGVYDKIPGDGREYCVAVREAVMVRAEDGRYVNNCNVSAFISNLPTPRGVDKAPDTQHFSSRNASGSTSQATNVVEAIEMGAAALLVDEDVSAANFMARDGRMRSLVMDESITPLLYRVNGLYNSHGISSVVVVGGVGDWLDVPHNVILLNRYETSDATKKAQSISYQFSYGHVQYAGRGVVHRLEWDKHGTPLPRRPSTTFASKYDGRDVSICMLEGGHAVAIHVDPDERLHCDSSMDDGTNKDEEHGCIDAGRMEQLLSRQQLYGCALCVLWILRCAVKHPSLGLPGLLNLLEETIDKYGMLELLKDCSQPARGRLPESLAHHSLIESVGYAQRPRLIEVGQALTRLRGIQLEELPVEDDGSEEAARLEAETRKKELAALWAARRKK